MPEPRFRFDSIPVDETYFTSEGYFIDHPIVTSTGIFEYKNKDGSIRRELRLPEEVFDPASLESYEGKPVIVTHEAGYVSKDNVEQEYIGTVLSKGYRDGEHVRAKIIIHNTGSLDCGLRELSLGYQTETDETPGEWQGRPYDAIQRNIRINHLALVANARAGDSARLNLDGDNPRDKGGTQMSRISSRADGFTPEEIQAAIEAYKARKAARTAPPTRDGEGTPPEETPPAQEGQDKQDAEETVQAVKERRDRRDAMEDPSEPENAMGVIAQQDEDIDSLLQVIAGLMARGDKDDPPETQGDSEEKQTIQKDSEADPPAAAQGDGDGDKSGSMKMDSADYVVRQRLEVARLGDKLGLSGLETLSLPNARKRIIKAACPGLRLDGRDAAYLEAAFDLARSEIAKQKPRGADHQRKQMFDPVQIRLDGRTKSASHVARERMISRMKGEDDR